MYTFCTQEIEMHLMIGCKSLETLTKYNQLTCKFNTAKRSLTIEFVSYTHLFTHTVYKYRLKSIGLLTSV